jgi:thiamine pyrophosphate-dependent acetolactate synthase large subunit-like protein
MKLYEALAKAFVDEGVTTVFGLMGDANMFWMNALDKHGVKLIDTRHEGVALAMADGYAQVTGVPGVATTTSGPGVTQLATSLVVAARAATPLVVFCGDTNVGDRGAVQRFNHEAFAAATESGHVRIARVEDAYEGVALAFYRARAERRPIMLSCAQDLQQQEFDDTEEYTPSTALWSTAATHPSSESLADAAAIVAGARRPVIIAGRGARGAAAEIRALAQQTGALIATTLLTKNFLADDEFHAGISGLFSTRAVIELFTECDCVISVGASMNHYTTEHGYLFPEARYVQIDDRAQAYLGDGRRADAYVQADAAVAVRGLAEALTEKAYANTGYRTPDVRARLDRTLEDPKEYEIPDGTIDPRTAYRALDAALPGDIGLVLGSGHQSHFGTVLMTRPRPMTLVNKHFGCIGQGLGTGIGAVVATGGRPAALVEGDSSIMMHIGDFETAVRHDVPLLIVVFNDESLGAEYHKSMSKGLRPELARVTTPNLAEVAVALGGRGWQVRNEDELTEAVECFAADPGPAIIDVRTAPTVLSIQYRRLWKGDPDA